MEFILALFTRAWQSVNDKPSEVETQGLKMTSTGVVLVGAGMAGISAAIWFHRLQLPFMWLEGGTGSGGQFLRINGAIPDYPGLEATSGRDFLHHLHGQLERLDLKPRFGSEVVRVDPGVGLLELAGSECLRPQAVLLATGAVPRRLGVPGEAHFHGAGVSDSATRDRACLRGRGGAGGGGGDAALENALILAEVCPQVFLVHRGTTFRGQEHFQAAVRRHPRIQVLLESRVSRILGDNEVREIELLTPAGTRTLAVRGVVVKVGVEANLGPWKGLLELDSWGYVRVDAEQRTSVPGVWAAGDVCNAKASSLVAAAGQAMVAVKSMSSSSDVLLGS